MTICFMIIVNTSGNGATTFAPLQHAAWHGFTPTDLVFPSFLFAVGNAQSFVAKKWAQTSRKDVVFKILKRIFFIFLVGYLMYWFPFFRVDDQRHIVVSPFGDTRIMGVLQRIALAYGLASLMIYFWKEKTVLVVTGLILLLYWPVLLYWGDPAGPLSLSGNAVLRLDSWLLGDRHLYHGEGIAFDPEGILGTFPAIANVVVGFYIGKLLQRRENKWESLVQIAFYGFLMVALAFMWNYVFPINKKLWTSSFVLLTSGLDCLVLMSIVYWVDLLGHNKGVSFFLIPGRNPLIIYLFSELFIVVLSMIEIAPGINLYEWCFLRVFSHLTPYVGAFVQSVAYMLVCWSLGWWMDRRKLYVKL
ncbi:MAG: DUF5009 domain-containing protein [Chitinophagaceae bacterium]